MTTQPPNGPDPGAEDERRVVPFRDPAAREQRTERDSARAADVEHAARLLTGEARDKDLVEHDRRCIQDSAAFRRRFWFQTDAAGRESIIDLQDATGLTDRQISLLWWSASLVLDGEDALIKVGAWRVAVGLFYVGIAALLMLYAFLAATRGPPDLAGLPAVIAIQLGLLAAGYSAFLFYIRPRQIASRLQRLGRLSTAGR